MTASVAQNQAEFDRWFDDPREATALLERVLDAEGLVRCYTTASSNPSQQLKNKLGQATSLKGGMLCLCLADDEAHDRARDALVKRWTTNREWQKAVSSVALAFRGKKKARIASIVEYRGSPFPERVRERLFPDVEIVSAVGAPARGLLGGAAAQDLAAELYLDATWVQECLWMLQDKRALVLYGPPGTGKTYIAQAFAEHLQRDAERRAIVQLHPSFAYEDFFEGYRPVVTDGAATLVKQDGPLRDLARIARSDSSEPVVLVMDEMNRGNLARVFGELFFLLEYRDASVRLMYSPDERFEFPPNLYLIGTMNTADRSIALLDQALRRRFYFAGLFPGEAPVAGMLRRYLDDACPKMAWVADVLDELNRRLGDRNVAIGPSHLMRPDLDDLTLRRVWSASIRPTIEEHLFGEDARLAQFDLDALITAVRDANTSSP